MWFTGEHRETKEKVERRNNSRLPITSQKLVIGIPDTQVQPAAEI